MRVRSSEEVMRAFDAEALLDEAIKLDEKLVRRRDRMRETVSKTHERQATKMAFVRSQFLFLDALCERSERRVERRSRSLQRLQQ